MKVVKYWRTEPVNKESDKYWSGGHYSEEAAIQYILNEFQEHYLSLIGEEFEVLPYYEIVYDWE